MPRAWALAVPGGAVVALVYMLAATTPLARMRPKLPRAQAAAAAMCFEHASGPRPEQRGQVLLSNGFGQALKEMAADPRVRRILEIGTWYGGGSTQSLVEGLGRGGCTSNATHHCCERFVVTFEIYEPAYHHARLFHQDNPVWLVLGTTVGIEHVLQDDEIPDKGEHYQLYYARDRALIESQPGGGQLERFCRLVRPELVLIDGNEYTGWGEFEVVRQHCRPRWIALHDTGTLKTRKIEAFMRESPQNFTLVDRGQDAAAGWAIYEVQTSEAWWPPSV